MRLTDALALALRDRWAGQRDADTSHGRALRCLRWLGSRRPTAATLRSMVSAMREAGLGPATINRHLSALSAVLEQAGVDVDLPWQREPRGRTRVLTRDEVTLLQGACLSLRHGPAIAALVGFLAETGMRVGEALALRQEDIEQWPGHPDGVRTVGRNPTPATTYWAVIRSSKNGDPRRVPLTAEAARCWTAGFIGLSQSTVNHVFRQARDRVSSLRGDREVVPHALRHTCASRLVDLQVSLPVVKDFLGHRSIQSTMRYVHPSKEGLAEAARRLESRA